MVRSANAGRTHAASMKSLPDIKQALPGPAKWIAVYVVFLLLLAGASVWYYFSESAKIQKEEHKTLATIAVLKSRAIADWRASLRKEVDDLAGSPFFKESVQAFLKAPGDPAQRARLLERIRYQRDRGPLIGIALCSTDGRPLLSAGDTAPVADSAEALRTALTKCGPVLSRTYKATSGAIAITAAAPVPGADGKPVALLEIRRDLRSDLFPLIEQWPGGEQTAETLLVERDGDEVVFLNSVRHKSNAALNLRIPLSKTEIPAVQAASGRAGQFLGTDYRGVSVLSDLRPIPDSPWFMVAKIDKAEAYKDLHGLMETVLFIGLCIAVAAAALLASLYYTGQVRLLQRIETERGESMAELQQLNKELEGRVEQRTAQLTDSNRELEAFAYSVSHDLRSPLRAIEGFASILEEEYGSKFDDEGRRLLRIVRANTQKMDELICGILELSRIVRTEVVPAEVDMTALARSAWEEIQASAAGADFELQELPKASGDKLLLRQVWANLLSNAVKYSARSAVRRIEVGSTDEGDATCYFVKDTGAGFDPAYASKLFGLFQRLHKESEFRGTGIGLANVQRIVHRHGGSVRAESRPGEGATFFFTLPKKANPL